MRRHHRPISGQGGTISWFALGVSVVFLLPLLVVVGMSFNPGEFSVFPPRGFSLRWFEAAWSNPAFQSAFFLSIQVALLSTAIGVLLSIPSALAIVRSAPRVQRLVQTLTFGPLIVPEILLGVGILIMINQVFGFGSVNVWTIVAGHVLVGIPLSIQVLVAGMAGVNEDLEKAAWTLGASKAKALIHVTLPLVAPAIASSALFLFIFSFDNVSMSLFLSRPGATTLPIYMYQYLQYRADPTVAAMSTILIVFGVVAALVLGRLGGLTQIAGKTRR